MSPSEPRPPADRAPAPLRVFLADDHPIVMAGIKALVTEDPRFEVIGEARDGLEALRRVTQVKPDILILDISMPGLNGVKVAERLQTACPSCRILALTVHEDRGYLRQLLAYGVAGYLLKRSAAEDLIHALAAIAAGGLYLDPAIAGLAVDASAASDFAGAPGGADLSQRELEVVRLTALGHSLKAVASELGVGVKSVETYKARAMEKLGCHTRVDLVRFAVRKGWLAG